MQEGITEAAPTVRVGILSPTGQHFIDILTPKTVNGLNMTPLGRVPVTISLDQARYDDIHIYPGIARALYVLESSHKLRNFATLLPTDNPTNQPELLTDMLYSDRTSKLLDYTGPNRPIPYSV